MNPGGWTRKVTDGQGTRYLDADGRLHRTDGPAWEFVNGDYEWHHHGMLHREDGPATFYEANTTRFPIYQWWYRGMPHRADGPAAYFADGREIWILYGVWIDEEHTPGMTDWLNSSGLRLPFDGPAMEMFKLSWHEDVWWHMVERQQKFWPTEDIVA